MKRSGSRKICLPSVVECHLENISDDPYIHETILFCLPR